MNKSNPRKVTVPGHLSIVCAAKWPIAGKDIILYLNLRGSYVYRITAFLAMLKGKGTHKLSSIIQCWHPKIRLAAKPPCQYSPTSCVLIHQVQSCRGGPPYRLQLTLSGSNCTDLLVLQPCWGCFPPCSSFLKVDVGDSWLKFHTHPHH